MTNLSYELIVELIEKVNNECDIMFIPNDTDIISFF